MKRQVTPTQLALFSRSPVIGAWWEELNKIDAQRAPKPKADSLDKFLFKSGHEHEKTLIKYLEAKGKKVKRLSGEMTAEAFLLPVS